MSPSTLDEAHEYVNRWYRLSGDNCPLLELPLTPEQQQVFRIGHAVKHINKSVGVISTQTESADHGETMDEQALRSATAKLLINTLMIAHELGLTSADLAAIVPENMKSKPTP